MAKKDYALKVGDPVIVKPDVFDPDFRIPIGGWQGRVGVINSLDNILRIDWDSLTLKNMPPEVIERCQNEGLYWHQMYLYPSEVEPTIARDSAQDAIAIVKAIDRGKSLEEVLKESGPSVASSTQWTFPRSDHTDHTW
ncbi:MAG: hypothetical protein F6K16_34365 [Symploca sp. SIO2B6]|nr:hypothetical protein [Symploca sp. SIO2B6]